MKKETGIAIIAALLVLVVVAILVLGTTFTSIIDRSISSNQRGATDAYYIAKAGVDKYKTIVFQTYRYYLDNAELYEDAIQSANPACGNYLNIGIDLNRDGVIDGNDWVDGQTLGPFNEGGGTYTVTFETAGRYAVITAKSTKGNSRSTVQVVAEPRNAGLFENALFAGPGQAAKFLNGNVEIRGSVYIEGDSTDPDKLVTDSTGNMGIYNYYTENEVRDMIANSSISVADIKTFLNLNYLEQEDMCVQVRVKDGEIKLSGSSSIGGAASQSVPSGFKTNVESVAISDEGSGDIQGVNRVHADVIRDFDLAGPPKFPRLDDNTLDLETRCDTLTNKTWRNCIHANTQVFTFNEAGGMSFSFDPDGIYNNGDEIVCADLACIEAREPGFTNRCNLSAVINSKDVRGNGVANSTVELTKNVPSGITYVDGSLNALDCTIPITYTLGGVSQTTTLGFKYRWNVPAKKKGASVTVGELETYGIVNSQGLDWEVAQDVQVRFDEKSTLFVEGKDSSGNLYTGRTSALADADYTSMNGGYVKVEGDILPSGCAVSTTPCPSGQETSFPDDSVLGIIADHSFQLTGVAQSGTIKEQVAMGLYYAGYKSYVQKGSVLFGSMIAPEFTFTSAGGGSGAGQTSKLIYVPGVTYSSAPGFNSIADPSKATFNIASFERR